VVSIRTSSSNGEAPHSKDCPASFTWQDSTVVLRADYEARFAAHYEEIGRVLAQVAWPNQ
jgi:hypothetical protein